MSKTAVITGATSGLGAAYAKRLAAEGYDLILSGRRKDIIQNLANSLAAENQVKVQVVIADLANNNDLQKLIEVVKSVDNVEMLINNAGYDVSRLFTEMDLSECEAMVKVHELAPMTLISAVVPNMIKAKKGAIINVSSTAAWAPAAGSSIYGSTKAFLKLFTESLYLELKDKGIKVQVLCPAFMDTDFYRYTTIEKKDKFLRSKEKLSLEKIVDYSLNSLNKNQPVCIPGPRARFACWMASLLPRKMVYSLVESQVKALR